MKKRMSSEEIDSVKNKIDTIFLTAKVFDDAADSLNVLDGMLICTIEKASQKDVREELGGIRLYLREILKDMENLSEL